MGNQTYRQLGSQDTRIPLSQRRTKGGRVLEDNRAAFNATPSLGMLKTNNPLSIRQTQQTATSHSNPNMAAQGNAVESGNPNPYATAQRQRIDNPAGNSTQQLTEAPLAKKIDSTHRAGESALLNNTGLPDKLKNGIEALSGLSMDNVKVHYNSAKPAQLNALAYAQGTDIHVGPGQEKHMPHEAWHVVQQAQGRVRPTMQMKDNVPVNDDKGLEQEADAMGKKAVQMRMETGNTKLDRISSVYSSLGNIQSIQRVKLGEDEVLTEDIETNDDLLELIESGNVDLQLFFTALEHNLITELVGTNIQEWADSAIKQMAGKEAELTELRDQDRRKQREDIQRQREKDRKENAEEDEKEITPSPEISTITALMQDATLEQQIGKITSIKPRAHKYIVFCGDHVVAIAKPGHEQTMGEEVANLKFLAEKGCSAVHIIQEVTEFLLGSGESCFGYIMENAAGWHSKEDDKTFQRTLFDMGAEKKELARYCLNTILDFSKSFSIGDLQLMLLDDGSVKVLDPLGIKKGESQTNIQFIEDMIDRLENPKKRPGDNKPNKGEKAI